jgi:hypothetical protein|tara:strand:- start:128 stop:322 length:195 start_codon:yes stop_codon:yes gene_type:complete
MSKIGTYALEVMEDEANTRYRNDMEAGSYLVLRNPARGRVKAKTPNKFDAVRAAPNEHEARSRT